MSLRLTEQGTLPEGVNALLVEEHIDEPGGAYMVIHRADENPADDGVGEAIPLNREQVVSLRDYLNKLLG